MLRLRKADRAAHQPFDPRPQRDVLAFDPLHMFCTNRVLFCVHMTLISAPPIGVKLRDAKRLQQRLEAEKDLILAPAKDLRQYLPTVMINGMPQPPWIPFLGHIGPHFVEF
jgi:hypothetical protein